jgi:hypothetical protein
MHLYRRMVFQVHIPILSKNALNVPEPLFWQKANPTTLFRAAKWLKIIGGGLRLRGFIPTFAANSYSTILKNVINK